MTSVLSVMTSLLSVMTSVLSVMTSLLGVMTSLLSVMASFRSVMTSLLSVMMLVSRLTLSWGSCRYNPSINVIMISSGDYVFYHYFIILQFCILYSPSVCICILYRIPQY